MRTTTKKLENAVTQIKVTFDKKEWAEAQDAALKRLATRVKLDGFRPGKAPVAMIKARLGKQAIYDEATDQILQKRYADIMKKAEVAPIAQPTLNIDSVELIEFRDWQLGMGHSLAFGVSQLSNNNPTSKKLSSTNAMGPCFNSPAA